MYVRSPSISIFSRILYLLEVLPSDEMQLVDELSMIYTTCIMCYATFAHFRSRLFAIALAIGLLSLAVFITAYYHYLQDPTFHQNAYALLTAVVLTRSMFVMEASLRHSWKKEDVSAIAKMEGISGNGVIGTVLYGTGKNAVGPNATLVNGNTMRSRSSSPGSYRSIEDIRDQKILKTMWTLIAVGLTSFLGGFGIWNLDNAYCSNLRVWRREVGLPWGILLEGHGWWHLLTGFGKCIL
jgi:dihydroceramidase